MSAVAIVLAIFGCHGSASRVTFTASQPAETLVGSPFDPAAPHPYRLYSGDELLIRCPTDTTLDQELRIRSDGMIALPYIDEVQAAGRAPAELTIDLTARYRETVLRLGEVVVIVTKEADRRIYLGGQVRSPGALTLYPHQTLSQAVFEAGGLTQQADAKQVLVIRARPGEGTYVLNSSLANILSGKEQDVRLEPFDVIFVPKTPIAKLGQFVEQYINQLIPRSFSFPFLFELYTRPVRIVDNNPEIPPVQITR